MSVVKVGILLELIGFILEALFVGIFFENVLIKFNKVMQFHFSSQVSFWKRRLGKLPTADRNTIIGIIASSSILGAIITGLLTDITWLFWAGIGLLLIVIALVYGVRESRKLLVPHSTRKRLVPLQIIIFLFLIPVGLIALLIPLVISGIGLGMTSLALVTLRKLVVIKWMFLSFGLLLILVGLVMQFITTA